MQFDIDGDTAKITREIEGGKEQVWRLNYRFVLGCQEPIAEWKIPNMRGIMTARTKPLKVVEPTGTDKLTTVANYELPAPRGAVKMIKADEAEMLIQLLHN
jgi:electron transfer flavoprotein beta subunit